MQWLAREVPKALDGSVGYRAAGRGPEPGRPVSAQAFGTPFASNECCQVAANNAINLCNWRMVPTRA
jgi:hypothetical protein